MVQMETDPVSKTWIMDFATNTLILRMSIIFVTSIIIFLLNLVNLLTRKQFILSCTIQPIGIKKWRIPNCKYIIKLKLWKVYFFIQSFHVWIRHKVGVKTTWHSIWSSVWPSPLWIRKLYKWTSQHTWGILAFSWRFNESRSFSTSCKRASVSCNRSWFSRSDSTSLSLSSSIETISCSKFASSPEYCELLWLMLSSAIVGITSHIIFHILRILLLSLTLRHWNSTSNIHANEKQTKHARRI